MKNAIILTICLVTILLQGCGSGSSANAQEIVNSVQEMENGNTSQTMALTVTTLVEGDQPLLGNDGTKQIRLINNEVDFASAWFNYTNEELPTIDFNQNSVFLYDRGALDLNNCFSKPFLDSVTAFEINSVSSAISMNYRRPCPPVGVSCPAIVEVGRPFLIVSINKSIGTFGSEIFISENVDIEVCN